jgi:hypothetical protein
MLNESFAECQVFTEKILNPGGYVSKLARLIFNVCHLHFEMYTYNL